MASTRAELGLGNWQLRPEDNQREPRESAAAMIQRLILENGQVSPDGQLLSLPDLNHSVLVSLVKRTTQDMGEWIRSLNLPGLTRENGLVVSTEASGPVLGIELADYLGFERVVPLRKGVPKTLNGEILTREIHSRTRGQPTIVSVEARYLRGKQAIIIDDFKAGEETTEAGVDMTREAGGKVRAICIVVSKPFQSSHLIPPDIPVLSLVTVDQLIPESNSQPAMIKFAGMPLQALKRRWGDG